MLNFIETKVKFRPSVRLLSNIPTGKAHTIQTSDARKYYSLNFAQYTLAQAIYLYERNMSTILVNNEAHNQPQQDNDKSIDQFQENGGDGEPDSIEIENVRVVVRVRPMDRTELEGKCENVIVVDKVNRCVTVNKPNSYPSEPPKVYFFDNVFAEDSTQVCSALLCPFLLFLFVKN